jgi:hypothetical protein
MSTMQQVFRQYGKNDVEKYMFLGVPVEWDEDAINQLTCEVREYMDQCLRNEPLEFRSHGQAFYVLMGKVFQFAEGAIWQHAFSLVGRDEPQRSIVRRSLAKWFDISGTENGVMYEFMFERLQCNRGHGLRPTRTTGQIATIVAALRESLAAHFEKDGIPDVPRTVRCATRIDGLNTSVSARSNRRPSPARNGPKLIRSRKCSCLRLYFTLHTKA